MISLIMSLVAIVTITDRPSSIRNRCVIEVFDGVFVLSRCFLNFSVCRGFCHRAVSLTLCVVSEFTKNSCKDAYSKHKH